MIKYVSVEEMIAIERQADASGLTYALMMENAGRNLADAIAEEYPDSRDAGVLGLVGSGNNGGDTLVALTRLALQGWRASACIVRQRPPDDPLIVRLTQAGGTVFTLEPEGGFALLEEQLQKHAILLDGVLGTGARLPLKPELAQVLGFVQKRVLENKNIRVVAVDCPSGVDCDSGEHAPVSIPAHLTVTMAAIKRGLLQFPAYNLVGKLKVVGIGIGDEIPYPAAWEAIRRFVPDRQWVASALPKRPLDAHKGTFGTALIVAGSVNYTGAAWLAGRAAYKSGAGLVTMAVPQPLHTTLAGQFPEATWLLLPDELGVIAGDAWRVLLAGIERATAILIGPGFGLEDTTRDFLANLFSASSHTRRAGMGLVPSVKTAEPQPSTKLPPVVLDADGLKLTARLPNWHRLVPAPAVLTPHPGEMSVLTGLAKEAIQRERVKIAEQYARDWGHVVVLKGAFTVVASPDGQTAVVPVATPALARAGTGDVLAGLIVGLRAQGLEAFPAAVAGAWIHAQAGLAAQARRGNSASVLAGDVLSGVDAVMADLSC